MEVFVAKVSVISSYSDTIVGVFLTREEAEEYLNRYYPVDFYFHDVERFIIDEY